MRLNVWSIVIDIVGMPVLCAGLGHNVFISLGYNIN